MLEVIEGDPTSGDSKITINVIYKGRAKTMSKNYYDDEIKYIDSNGDIHLHDGVHKLNYNTHIKPDELETHLNEIDLKVQKRRMKEKELYTREDGITEY